MSETNGLARQADSARNHPTHCPKCGQVLNLEAGVQIVHGAEIWTEEWFCPDHGLIYARRESLV